MAERRGGTLHHSATVDTPSREAMHAHAARGHPASH
jgi:hypothetical protein